MSAIDAAVFIGLVSVLGAVCIFVAASSFLADLFAHVAREDHPAEFLDRSKIDNDGSR